MVKGHQCHKPKSNGEEDMTVKVYYPETAKGHHIRTGMLHAVYVVHHIETVKGHYIRTVQESNVAVV